MHASEHIASILCGLHHFVPRHFTMLIDRHLAQKTGERALCGSYACVLRLILRNASNELFQRVDGDILLRLFSYGSGARVIRPMLPSCFDEALVTDVTLAV